MLPEPERPSPDALLARANREGRGRLKVFFGAAPGVGKTYAMLLAARAAVAEGREVVAGIVETHGRRETEALVEGLEGLPRRTLVHRNRAIPEFDLDAALARRPGVLLLDELAHTNAPGSRHPKRWQDARELVAAGLEVWTTLNVQHLESVNDVVRRITHVQVRETVPDGVLDEADEIVLIDLPAEELLKRLAEGKIYVQDTAARAVQNFFKVGNLTALRELALRRAAERVDDDLVERMRAGAIEGPWAAGERILACLGPDPLSPGVARAAKRLADLVGAPWVAVTVEGPGEAGEDRAKARADVLAFARSLGAGAEALVGTDVPGEVLAFARRENVTQIVVGRSGAGGFARLRGRSLPEALVARAEDIAVHVVTAKSGSPSGGRAPSPPRASARGAPDLLRGALPYAWSLVAVALAVGFGLMLAALSPLPNLSMVFLVAVLYAAVAHGMRAAVLASGASFLAYNFFFISPLYTFTVADPYEVFALLIFLIVAVVTAALAGRARDQARAAAGRVRTTRRLYEFTRRLSAIPGRAAVAEAVAVEVHQAIGRGALLLLEGEGSLPGSAVLALTAAWPPEDALDPASEAAALWAYERGEAAGAGTGTLPAVPWLFLPLGTPRARLGALGVAAGAVPLDTEGRALLDTLAEQAAAALERAALARESAQARAAAESERLRNTLLASISHDFRTPLAAVIGSATSLIDYGDHMDETQRRDLLAAVRDEAEGLDRMVRDLLAITRIESGGLELRAEWIDLADVAARVAEAARRRGTGRVIEVVAPAGGVLARADARLIEQALTNLLGNALTHAGPGARIFVEAFRDGREARLTVTDDGPGISPALLARAFEKFARGNPGGERAGEGFGLGLAIARGIAGAHEGEVTLESPVAGGRGTRASLVLPGEAAPAVDAPAREAAA